MTRYATNFCMDSTEYTDHQATERHSTRSREKKAPTTDGHTPGSTTRTDDQATDNRDFKHARQAHQGGQRNSCARTHIFTNFSRNLQKSGEQTIRMTWKSPIGQRFGDETSESHAPCRFRCRHQNLRAMHDELNDTENYRLSQVWRGNRLPKKNTSHQTACFVFNSHYTNNTRQKIGMASPDADEPDAYAPPDRR